MGTSNFEGSLILEKLAEIGKVDEFYEAIDADDIEKVKRLLKIAGIDAESILALVKELE